ncbi:MAG: hypothetical protein JXA25_01750 [Anaerolineales bacterium]|nr:hypothetical protein [Anaerolineales bacterium]
MEQRTTGLIAAVLAGVVSCFCAGILLLLTGLLAGLSLPFLKGGLLAGSAAQATMLPSPTPTQDVSSGVATMDEAQITPSPYAAMLDEAENIQQQVQLLRGLEPFSALECTFISFDELNQLMEQDSPVLGMAEEDAITFQALGLYDPQYTAPLEDEIPADVLLAVLDEQSSGCSVLLQEDQAGWQADYARSYVRALLRQHHYTNTDTDCTLFLPDYDSCLAQRALLEGDVFLLTRQWQRQFGEPEWPEPELIEYPQSDSFLSRMASFPFLYGYNYVQQAYLEKGWAGVDALYSQPLNTTRQILHSNSRTSTDPVGLEPLQDISGTLGPDWDLVKQGSMGEWLIHLFLNTELPEEETLEAAAGWDIDIYQVYQNTTSGELILIWAAQWKNIPAVYTARKAIRDFAEGFYGEVRRISPDEVLVESSPAARIERSNLQTLFITGPDPELVELVRERLKFPFRSQ